MVKQGAGSQMLDRPAEFDVHGSEHGDLVAADRVPIDGVRIGSVIALTVDGALPLVTYPGQPGTAALSARATVDIHASHLGKSAVLMFEGGDPDLPIVIGFLKEPEVSRLPGISEHIEVHANGEHLVVAAKEQVVLRCGKASITLTRAGKIVVQGTYVVSRSSGVLRIKGGSVQIN